MRLRAKVTEEVAKNLEKAIGDLQEIAFGWNLDAQAEKCYLDVNLTAKPGSDIAKAADSLKTAHSRFTGFRAAGAAIVGNWNGQMPAFKTALLDEIVAAVQKRATAEMAARSEQRARRTGQEISRPRAAVGQRDD